MYVKVPNVQSDLKQGRASPSKRLIEYIKNDFDYFQLHGNEDVKRIKEIRQKFNKKITRNQIHPYI